MEKRCSMPVPAKLLAGGVAVGVASYAAYVAATWTRYGRSKMSRRPDSLLDTLVPDYEVGIQHQIAVEASAECTFDAACRARMGDSAIIEALFKVRELIFGHPVVEMPRRDTLLEQMTAIGWMVLAEVPGRELVFGTVTQPWRSDAVFRAVPAEQFAAFDEPGYVKIVWTLRADPVDATSCIALTETRVATTDAEARRRFRWYWSCLSPGIKIIRHVMLRKIKRAAEQPGVPQERAAPPATLPQGC